MRKTLALLVTATALLSVHAQNPVIRDQYTADPTARVFGGRLYLFPSHDIISPIEPERKWFAMADYHMFTSNNLTDWTDQGVILSQEQVPWGNPTGYSMWAPDCVEHNGKYYFYYPDAPKEGRGFGIGVAISNSLFGAKFVPEEKNIAGVAGIDPCVLQASDGNCYLFWGGGRLVQAKLKDNMLELDGQPQRITGLPQGFTEGPFAMERNGKYYLTYPWVRKDGGTECLAYAMSDNPMGPWEYKGVIMEESPTKCWTNHHSIVEWKGQWYLFYHHNDYSPNFDKNRSVCIDSLFFNEDGTIQPVKATRRGVGITDARRHVEVDRYSDIGGGASIEYLDTTDYFLGWKTLLPQRGAWISYNRVDTKSASAQNVCIKVKTKNKAQLRLQLNQWSAVLAIPNTQGQWTEVNLPVKTMPKGVSDLRLSLGSKTAAPVEVDWLSLTDEPRPTLFVPASQAQMAPDEQGFIRRWMLLEPINNPTRSNTIFTESYLQEYMARPAFAPLQTATPTDGSLITIDGQQLKWHAVESTRYNVKLFRFASWLQKQEYRVDFRAQTVIDCPEEIQDVRLAVGSNGASVWWLNGQQVLVMDGDRRMVMDDGTSRRLTLHKGRNILRGAVLNGPGLSDMCIRFIDDKGQPVKGYSISAQ